MATHGGRMTNAAVKDKPAKAAKKAVEQDPEEPMLSLSGEVVEFALTPPDKKTVVLAKDMISEELYANVFPMTMGNAYKMHRLVEKKDGKVAVMFYADTIKEWLHASVEPGFKYTTDERYTYAMSRPTVVSKEERRKRAAHLPKFKKTKPDPEAKPTNGKSVFKGKLLKATVLFDTGDGAKVAKVAEGQKAKDAAKAADRKLVGQDEATEYAIWNYSKQWHLARQGKKD